MPDIKDHLVVKVITANACFIKDSIQYKFKIDQLEGIKLFLKNLEKGVEEDLRQDPLSNEIDPCCIISEFEG